MRNLNAYLFPTILTLLLFPFRASSQAIKSEYIKKIEVEYEYTTRGPDTLKAFEINRSGINWTSFRVAFRVQPSFIRYRQPLEADPKKTYVSSVNKITINELLFAVSNPTALSPAESFGITSEYLRANTDSIFRKAVADHLFFNKALTHLDARELLTFKQGITTEKIDHAIKDIFRFPSMAVDGDIYRRINIIKIDNDTIKLRCDGFRGIISPWILNGKDTIYNMAISRFYSEATGDDFFKNNQPFIDEGFYSEVYSSIYADYFMYDFNYAFLQKRYPEIFKKLSADYAITRVRLNKAKENSDTAASMNLHPRSLPPNVIIEANLHILDAHDLDTLSHYREMIDDALKKNNFVFDHVMKTPDCWLYFRYDRYESFLYSEKQKKYAYLQNYPRNKIVYFYVREKKEKPQFSNWYILPDGHLVLTYFLGDNPLAFIRKSHYITIPNTVSYDDVCVVFNNDGEIFQNFTP